MKLNKEPSVERQPAQSVEEQAVQGVGRQAAQHEEQQHIESHGTTHIDHHTEQHNPVHAPIPGLGFRSIKTALAAMFTALIYVFLPNSNPTFACIGAIFGMGADMEESRRSGGNRFFGTVIGGFIGVGVILAGTSGLPGRMLLAAPSHGVFGDYRPYLHVRDVSLAGRCTAGWSGVVYHSV